MDLNYFLGIEVTRTAGGLPLMQRQYIIDLLAKVNMHETNHASMPLATFPKLTLNIGNVLACLCEFQMVTGNLKYLAFTQPKIAYIVNRLSQFMHQLTDEHWKEAERILRYLSGTLSHGIYI